MNKFFAPLSLSVSLALLAGCVTTIPDPYPNIKIATAGAVANCKHVGHFSANATTPYGLFTGRAEDSLREMVKKEAYKLGATDIVLDTPITTDDDMTVNGKAYICPQM